MATRRTRTLLLTVIVILGCGVLGFIFWKSEKYRAATPLVFILGFLALFIPMLDHVLKLFMTTAQRTRYQAHLDARRSKEREKTLWHYQIPQLVADLYFGHIQHYPEWIHESRDYVPSSVTNAGKTEEGWVRLLLYYADYVFSFKEWNVRERGTGRRQGVLEIRREGEKVFTLQVTQIPNKEGILRWQPVAIESAALTREWVRDLENLHAEVLAIIKDRKREARES